ncbi:8296_t:CDS:2, partial [Funneliformis mosseae]
TRTSSILQKKENTPNVTSPKIKDCPRKEEPYRQKYSATIPTFSTDAV